MLVESKYFQCEKCGEHSICLIFAPQAETAIQLIGLKPRKPQNVTLSSVSIAGQWLQRRCTFNHLNQSGH